MNPTTKYLQNSRIIRSNIRINPLPRKIRGQRVRKKTASQESITRAPFHFDKQSLINELEPHLVHVRPGNSESLAEPGARGGGPSSLASLALEPAARRLHHLALRYGPDDLDPLLLLLLLVAELGRRGEDELVVAGPEDDGRAVGLELGGRGHEADAEVGRADGGAVVVVVVVAVVVAAGLLLGLGFEGRWQLGQAHGVPGEGAAARVARPLQHARLLVGVSCGAEEDIRFRCCWEL